MSEARTAEEAARSLRLALYELQLSADWSGGATRAEIIRHCLSRQLPTPERYFEAALEQVDLDRTAPSAYESSMDGVRYSLTQEGRAEVARERLDHHLSYLDESAASASSPPPRANAVFSHPATSSSAAVRPERVPDEPRTPLPAVLALWSALPESQKLFVAFALGMIAGAVLSNLR